MIIFVAGPYSAMTEDERLANVNTAIDAGIALAERGHVPYVPHLSHWFDIRCEEIQGERKSWIFYMRQTLAMLTRCDGLYFVGSSKGADLEREEAVRLGLPIWDRIDDVPVEVER